MFARSLALSALGLFASAAATAQDCTPPLVSSLAPTGDFGAALAARGQLLVVGAPLADLVPGGPPVHPYGRAELFEYDARTTTWNALDVLGPPPSPLGVINNEGFASAIAIGDETLFFGWPGDILGGNGTVRPYRRSTPSIGWLPETPIQPPFQSATGRFGVAVAASDEFLAVGEQLGEGRVHVYERSPAHGGWTLLQTLVPPAPGSLTGTFGQSVAVLRDWIFVGDPGYAGALHGSGHVLAYRRDNLGTWQFVQRLSAVNSNPLTADGFGASLAVVPEMGRDTLFVGSQQEVSPIGVQTGAAHVFVPGIGPTWVRSQILHPPAAASGRSFGASIAASGGSAMIGAPSGPFGTAPAGEAYLVERDPVSRSWSLVGRYTHGATGTERAGVAVAVGDWHAALGAPGAESVRATPAYPLRDVDADQVTDSCEALHAPVVCPSVTNSTGRIGRIHVDGTLDISAGATQLAADQITPHSFGYFITSRAYQVTVPPGQPVFGILCLGGAIGRFNASVQNAGAAGRVHFTIDPGQLPQPMGPVTALPGETWFFQYWHRDLPPVGQQFSNFTETARVTFE